jgi:hypothetical protein
MEEFLKAESSFDRIWLFSKRYMFRKSAFDMESGR